MAEIERRQRVISSTPRLAPDEVANHTFSSGFRRGLSESEVRAFLRRVADELTALREREQQLLGAVDDLEEQVRRPRPLNEQELLDALGEETARLLRSAREAADDIRNKADARAAHVMEEAQAEAQRMRAEAAEVLEQRTQEADARAAEIVAGAEGRAKALDEELARTSEEQRQRAEQEAAAIVEAARVQGREMLDEARVAREKVVADLGRRRTLLQAQVDELRQGRDRLLEAYRVVKRAFLEATDALANAETRAVSSPTPDETVPETAAEVPGPGAGPEPAAGTRPPAGLADVDSLFARIRAAHDEPVPRTAVEIGQASAPAPATAAEPGSDEIVLEETPRPTPAVDAPRAWRERHLAEIQSLQAPLVKRAKRAAQDDQNALLDAVRRHKGRPTAAQVLQDDETLASAWSTVLRSAVDDAYGAGRVAAGGPASPADDALLREAAQALALPLRDRLAAAIDDPDGADTAGLVERIGARYREWKNQRLESGVADVLAVAWSRGVYDAAPDGAVLRWIPFAEGRCADCDDNALEPTTKGSAFPTGQIHPPAHPGCRCLLAPADVLAGVIPVS